MTSTLYVEPAGDLPPSQLLARRIREIVAGRQISGTKLAEAIDLDQRAFSRRYRGRTPWTVDELYALAGVLGLNVSELLPRLDSNQQPFGSSNTQVSAGLDLTATLSAAEGPAEHVARILGPIQPAPTEEPGEGRLADVIHLTTWRPAARTIRRGRRTEKTA